MRRGFVLALLACAVACYPGLAAPDLSDGVQVLAMLAAPYGANTYLLKTQFELLGWEVTLAGIARSVPACSRLCSTLFADLAVAEIGSVSPYDVLVVMPTPGAFQRVRNPVGDLRGSERAVGLVREAYDVGLTLYAGCSGILLLGDAGVLAGARVVAHPNRISNCREYGADCTRGSPTVPPGIDGQLVTATNQRVWPLEIAAAIARSLDAGTPFAASEGGITSIDVNPAVNPIDSEEPGVAMRTVGGAGADTGRDLCPVEGGTALVGSCVSDGRREDVLVVRFDSDGVPVWAKAVGGPGRDVGEAVCESEDGGLFVAGYTTSAGAGLEDVLVLKLGPDGDLEWAATFGGADYDAAFDLCPSDAGGVTVCGLTYSSGAGLSDLYVVKVGPEGEQVWARTIGGERIERGHGIQRLGDGGYIVAGGTSSFGAGNVDMYAVRLDSSGREIWSETYGRNVYDVASSVASLRDGGFLITGHGDLEGTELMALTVVRIGSDGTELWTSRFGSSRDYDYGVDAVELSAGGFLVVGMTDAAAPGLNDVWAQVIDDDGRSTSSVRFGGDASDWPGGVCVAVDGTILVAGTTASYGAGSYDAMLLELSMP